MFSVRYDYVCVLKTERNRNRRNETNEQPTETKLNRTIQLENKQRNKTNHHASLTVCIVTSFHRSSDTLRSALATRWPRLHRMSPWFDEVYLAVSLVVESRFLANHSSLLSESFYGLRRCRYAPKPETTGEIIPLFTGTPGEIVPPFYVSQ